MKRIIFILAATLLSFNANALTIADLTPASSDGLLVVLNTLFGDVGGIFGTGTTTVFGDMMGVFNAGVMLVAGSLLGYIFLSGTLKTAHEGEALGRAWSSIFIPIRAAMGVAIIIPGAGGYALVNVFIMYVTIVGVGLANKVWYVAAENVMFGKPTLSRNIDANTVTSGVLKSMICNAYMNKYNIGTNYFGDAEGESDWSSTYVTRTEKTLKYSWGPHEACGSLEFNLSSVTANQLDSIYRAKAESLPKIVLPAIKLLAENVVNGEIPKNFNEYLDAVSENYTKYVKGFAETAYAGSSVNNDFLSSIRHDGFIMAGGSYLSLTKIMKVNNLAANESPSYTSPDVHSFNMVGINELQDLYITADTLHKIDLKKRLEKPATPAEYASDATTRISAAGQFTIDDIKSGSYIDHAGKIVKESIKGALISYLLPTPVGLVAGVGPLGYGMGKFATFAGGQLTGVNNGAPLLSLMHFGDTLEIMAAAIVATFIAGPTTVHIIANMVPFLNEGSSMTTMVTAAAPIIYSIVAGLGGAGLTLSTYLPMLPAITWVLAIISLIILVFESMLASSIWGVMHISPDGHEWSGKGSDGYMLVLGVFLRPTLMIFGLVGGMTLFSASVIIINFVFLMAVESFEGVGIVSMVLIICLYVFTVVKAFHRSLSMITELPSGIMRWAGGGHSSLGEDPQSSGTSFVAGIAGRAESAGGATMAARKNDKDKLAAAALPAAESKGLNNKLMSESKSTNGPREG